MGIRAHQPFLPGDPDWVALDTLPPQGRTISVNGTYLHSAAPSVGDVWITAGGVPVVIVGIWRLWHGGCKLLVREPSGRKWVARNGTDPLREWLPPEQRSA